MGRTISAHGEQAGALLIDRSYRDGDEFQWLRELVKNGIEANATKIQVGVHWRGVDQDDWGSLPARHHLLKGVYRSVYYDNGDGMGPGMAEYMTGLLALDSKDSLTGDLHSNKAMGARVSTLPWNRLGMVVASWHKDHPEGRLMWLHYVDSDDPETIGHYEAATLEWEDGSGTHYEDVAPANLYDEFIDDRPSWLGPQPGGTVGTGTMFLMLGDRADHNTILGPESTWKNTDAHRYLAERFWELPENLELNVEVPYNSDLSTWRSYAIQRHGNVRLDGEEVKAQESKRHYSRPVTGGLGHATSPVKDAKPSDYERLVMPNDRGTIHVYLGPETRSYGSWEQGQKPLIGVLYRNELYHRGRDARAYRQWGVGPIDVRQRLWIIVEPREADHGEDPFGGVYPTGGRTSLQYVQPVDPTTRTRPDGKDLPMAEYREFFIKNMPTFLRDAILAETSSSDDKIDENLLNRISERLKSRFNMTGLVKKDSGDQTAAEGPRTRPDGVPAPPTLPGTRRRSETRRRRVAPAPDLKDGSDSNAKSETTTAAMPLLQWDPTGEQIGPEGVTWTPGDGAGTVTINKTHPVFAAVLDYWHDLYAPTDHPAVDEAIWSAYGVALTCRVAHILSFNQNRDDSLTSSQLEETLLSSDALTSSLFGLASEDKVIQDRLSGRPKLK